VGHVISDTLASFPPGGVVTYTVVGGLGILDDVVNTAALIPPSGVVDPNLVNNRSTIFTRYRVLLPSLFRKANP
jgi:hypothetical protein